MSRAAGRIDSPAEPAPKRRRVAQACTPCRQRKSRCNGARPVCSACAELKHQCSWLNPEDAQQVSIGRDYLKTLEQRLSLLEATVTIPGQQGGHSPAHLRSTTLAPAVDGNQIQPEKNDSYESAEGPVPKNSSSRDPTDGMGHYIFADEEDVGYFGPSSNIYFTRDISNALQRTVQTLEAAGCQIARIQHLDRGVLSVSRPPSPPPMAAMLGRQRQTPRNATMGSEPQESDSYLLPPEGETTPLLKKYFADTGMLFPYLHPPTFMQTYKEIRQERRPVRRTWLALLSMILAITVSTDTEHAIDAKQRQKRSHVFYSRAMQLVGGLTSTHASLETVQYLLVTSQYLQGTSTSSQTWAMHGLAVKAALQLGLHSTQALKRYPPLEQEIGKRTWFGCVVLDRTLSMTFGRPPTIPESLLKNMQLAVPYDVVTEPDTSPSSQYSTDFFNATITLYKILGDAMQLLYGDNLGGDQHQNIYQQLADILQLEERLKLWSNKIPSDLDLTKLSASAPDVPYRLAVILRLRYLNLRSLIHRSVISSVLRNVGSVELNASFSPSLDLARKASLETCVISSLETIATIRHATSPTSTRPKVLGAWWFSLYYTVDAALGLFAASVICYVHPQMAVDITSSPEDWKHSIQQAVETLSRLDRGNRIVDKCRDCLTRLEQVLAQLNTASLNINSGIGTSSLGGLAPFISASPHSPILWTGNDAAAADGQPSFLNFDSLFDNSFLFVNDLELD